jgi:NAD(P)-dependent dehydrogenase (short-subunit alcohol dehydrogenase family)
VRVNAVAQGTTVTDMTRGVLTAELEAVAVSRTALRRLGAPDDIAKVVAFPPPMTLPGLRARSSRRAAVCDKRLQMRWRLRRPERDEYRLRIAAPHATRLL